MNSRSRDEGVPDNQQMRKVTDEKELSGCAIPQQCIRATRVTHPIPIPRIPRCSQSKAAALRLDLGGLVPIRYAPVTRRETEAIKYHNSRASDSDPSTGGGSSDLIGQWKPGEEPTEKFPVPCQCEFATCLGIGERSATIDDRRERRRIGRDC